MPAIWSARERDVLDYLRQQAEDRLIASLPSAKLRVMAALTPSAPHLPAWKVDA